MVEKSGGVVIGSLLLERQLLVKAVAGTMVATSSGLQFVRSD
jgi:hypothetical protein